MDVTLIIKKKNKNSHNSNKNFMLKNYNKNMLYLVDYIMTPSSFCKKKYLKKLVILKIFIGMEMIMSAGLDYQK